MPIYGLTDVPESYLKLGQIRKGAPKNENAPGKDLDYFRVTFLKNIINNVNYGELLQKRFLEVYGEKPAALNIQFANDMNMVWDANYECYKQGGYYAGVGSSKDGLYWIFYRDFNTAEVHISGGRSRTNYGDELLAKPINLREPLYKNTKGEPFFLEPVGRLQVVIEELANIVVGYFEFRPESPRDIRQISAELGLYEKMARQVGKSIAGVPFTLLRREEAVSKKIDGKLVASTSYVVHLSVNAEWGARALSVIERLALPEIVEGDISEISQIEVSVEPDRETNYKVAAMKRAEADPPMSKNIDQDTGDTVQPIEIIEVMGEWAVNEAARLWNINEKDAAIAIGKKLHGKMDKREFLDAIK